MKVRSVKWPITVTIDVANQHNADRQQKTENESVCRAQQTNERLHSRCALDDIRRPTKHMLTLTFRQEISNGTNCHGHRAISLNKNYHTMPSYDQRFQLKRLRRSRPEALLAVNAK